MKRSLILIASITYSFLGMASDPNHCSKILQTLQNPNNRPEDIAMSDPYRWLEKDSPARQAWIKAQKEKTHQYLRQTDEAIKSYWREVLNGKFLTSTVIAKFPLPQNAEVQLVSQGLGKNYEVQVVNNGNIEKILFSSKDQLRLKDHFGIMDIWYDPYKKYVVVPVSYNGSTDLIDLHIIEISSGKQVDLIENANNSEPLWESRETIIYQKLLKRDRISLVHKIGRDGDLIDSFNEGELKSSPHQWFNFYTRGTNTRIRRIDQEKFSTLNYPINNIVGETDNFIYFTQRREGWESLYRADILPSGDIGSAKLVSLASGILDKVIDDQKMVLAYYRLGINQWALLFDQDGEMLANIRLPKSCKLVGFNKLNEEQVEIEFSSQIRKKKKFIYQLKTKSFLEDDIDKVMLTDDQGRIFESTFINVKSKDGAEFPVRLTHLKGLTKDHQNPTLVEGYGGFGVPGYFYPKFDYKIKELLNQGGVYAAPILRGGDELGPIREQQAQGAGKQHTFDDMAATLKSIQVLGYTSPEKTAIMGWSNGGLLIGTMAVQTPELFKMGIVGNGVLDMLRKDYLDPRYADGWSYEYGDLQSSSDFLNLKKYSPVHNAKETNYPTIMVVNGTSDSRVNPVHSFKFTAAVQDAQQGQGPIMLLPVKNSGHWVTSQDLEKSHAYVSLLYIWSSIFKELGVQVK